MALMRAAVVGVGYLGNFHAQKYKALSQKYPELIQLVGVCDTYEPQAEKIAKELGVMPFTQAGDLISLVDMVTIATITPKHYELAKYFLQNKIHVNVEKPICLKTEQARELVNLAEKNNLTLTVGHSERFSPTFKELKKKVHRPRFVELSRYAPFNKRGSDVSVIHDLMIHDLDLLLSMDSTKYRVVSASCGKVVTSSVDWVSATIEFESGLRAQVNSSRLAREMTRTIKAFDNTCQYFANLQTGDLEITQKQTADEPPVIEVIQLGRADNLLAETENFILASHGKAPATVTGKDGLRALELAEQIIASLDTHVGG